MFIKILWYIFKVGRSSPGDAILILSLHRIGDTVFNVPAIKEIVKFHKNKEVKILCFKDTKPILNLVFEEKKIATINKSDLLFERRIPNKNAMKIVHQINPNIIYDLTGMPLSAALILTSKAQKVIGRNIPYLKSLYHVYTPLRTEPHFFDAYYDVVRSVIPENKLSETFEFKRTKNKINKILIHPFGIRKAKEWNLRKYVELGTRLADSFQVSIVSPPDYLSIDVEQELLNDSRIDLKITHRLDQLIKEIETTSLYIGNDSGPTYIASLIGIPTFTIYGPTNPVYSLPFGDYHDYILKNLSCSADQTKFCFTLGGIYCPSNECMQQIEVDEVEDKILKFIERLKQQPNRSNV